MKFDVIIGNPPYQLQDGGAQKSALPIYHLFIQQAKKLSPRYMTMIVPARWYAGGKGLDKFRSDMLHDKHLTVIHDFPETTDLFPKLNIRGGVCYFLWDRDNPNDLCQIYNHRSNEIVSSMERPLLEPEVATFIRYNAAIDILRKVHNLHEPTMDSRVSSRKPFGLPTDYNEYTDTPSENSDVLLYRHGGIGYVNEDQTLKNHDLIDQTKVIISYASSGGDAYPHLVLGKPILAKPRSACTETYLIVDVLQNEDEGRNLISYITTRFFRLLVLLLKNTQHVTKKAYSFVPIQDFSKPWTDEELYAKYGISNEEIAFIESLVKPMEAP